ncbi:MAG: porin [Puniceicoccales bacterium]|nr:porin [Puniceicoccales bacterium]
MRKLLLTAGLATALTAAGATNASAEISLLKNDKVEITTDGYIGLSATVSEYENDGKRTKDGASLAGGDNSGTNLDAAKVGLKVAGGNATGYVSAFWSGDNGSGVCVLDAYVSYGVGEFTFTAGKFLSYLGYESYYISSMDQLTYGAAVGIPSYHSGVKADWSHTFGGKEGKNTLSVGLAILDSLYGEDSTGGDGEVSDIGIELCATYAFAEKFTVFAGIGYESGNDLLKTNTSWVLDVWGSYQVNKKLKLAAEITYYNKESQSNSVKLTLQSGPYYQGVSSGFHYESTAFLLFAQVAFTEKISTVFRVGATMHDNFVNHNVQWQATVAPTFTVNEFLRFRAELSYYTGGSQTFGQEWANSNGVFGSTRNGVFLGFQTVFSW